MRLDSPVFRQFLTALGESATSQRGGKKRKGSRDRPGAGEVGDESD